MRPCHSSLLKHLDQMKLNRAEPSSIFPLLAAGADSLTRALVGLADELTRHLTELTRQVTCLDGLLTGYLAWANRARSW